MEAKPPIPDVDRLMALSTLRFDHETAARAELDTLATQIRSLTLTPEQEPVRAELLKGIDAVRRGVCNVSKYAFQDGTRFERTAWESGIAMLKE